MRYDFEVVRRQVSRKLPCKSCGKVLTRHFTGECTVNPFNKGTDGEPLSRDEVGRQSIAAAEREAAKAEAEGVTCQWCSEAPYRDALIALADGQPLAERKYGNPTDILIDRGNVEEVADHSPCPTCNQRQWKVTGYRLTDKGRRLADKLSRNAKGQDQ